MLEQQILNSILRRVDETFADNHNAVRSRDGECISLSYLHKAFAFPLAVVPSSTTRSCVDVVREDGEDDDIGGGDADDDGDGDGAVMMVMMTIMMTTTKEKGRMTSSCSWLCSESSC